MLTPREIAEHAPDLSGQNLLINGDFQISQRGDYTSPVTVIPGVYNLDRWATVSVGVDSEIQQVINGYAKGSNSLRMEATTAATGYMGNHQKIEFPEKYEGKTIKLSAKVKSNNSNVRFVVYQGVTHTWAGPVDNPHTGGGGWETLSVEVNLPSDNLTELRIALYMRGQSGENVPISIGDYMEWAEVKCELGSVATPFVSRSVAEELALCRRYYETVYQKEVPVVSYNPAYLTSESAFFKVEKRDVPTIVELQLSLFTSGDSNFASMTEIQSVNINVGSYSPIYTHSTLTTIQNTCGRMTRLISADAEL